MMILALEFSSLQRSAAVAGGRTGASPLAEVVETGARGPAMIGLIEEAQRQAQVEREQIECLAIGIGPGSYTGIRSAIALAQGWKLASVDRNIKFIGLSSADCIAAQAQAEGVTGRVAVVIDAQRNEFYLASYEVNPDSVRAIQSLRLASLLQVQAQQQAGEIIVGPEVSRWFQTGRMIFPRAAALAQMARVQTEFVSAQNLEPIYLRETQFVKAPPPRILPSC